MDEVLNACSFQVVHASGSAGNDEHGAAIHGLEGGYGILGVLVVAGAEHHNIGLGSHGGLYTLFYGSEAEVVLPLQWLYDGCHSPEMHSH